MRVDLFDFDLPEQRIALRPAPKRDQARLLLVKADQRQDHSISDLPQLLNSGDILVINNTRVIPAYLQALRPPREEGGATQPVSIDLTLHERTDAKSWLAFARPGKRLQINDRLTIGTQLEAVITAKRDNGEVMLQFNRSGAQLDAVIAAEGRMPLPPYIAGRRPVDARDREDYQTVFATHDGAVAAPTAGLHFTTSLIEALTDKGVDIAELTLHVGPGTFLTVKAEDTEDHVIHSEKGQIEPHMAERINRARARGGRVIALGTTSLRLLEAAASHDGHIEPFRGEIDLFITPGYRFKTADMLLTNFHLPRSTLFMLVCAFAGFQAMHDAYGHAIGSGYRFYSYGDANLLFRHDLCVPSP